MQKNLDVATYSDGTPIPEVTDRAVWATLTTGAWCYYQDNSAFGTIYGKLYNWYAVAGIHDNDPNTPNKKLAPNGWHVASDAERRELSDCLGGQFVAGGKLKEAGTIHWESPNTDATNSSGFTGLPGGVRLFNGSFTFNGIWGFWWSASEFDDAKAFSFTLSHERSTLGAAPNDKRFVLSVRCVKD